MQAVQGVDGVIHLAAFTSVAESTSRPSIAISRLGNASTTPSAIRSALGSQE